MQGPIFLHQKREGGRDVGRIELLIRRKFTDDLAEEPQVVRRQRVDNLLFELRDAFAGDGLTGRRLHRLDGLVRGPLYTAQHAHFPRRNKQNRITGSSRAARTTDTVDVSLNVVGHVVVDDMADARHVQAARGNVSRDHDVQLLVLQLLNCAFPLLLIHIAVQCRTWVAAGFQFFRQLYGCRFRSHKNQRGVDLFHFENAGQCIKLMQARYLPVALTNRGNRARLAANLEFFRIVKMAARYGADLIWHRRREQRDLTLLRRVLKNPFHIIDKAHTQHFIAFIQHDGADACQRKCFPAQVIHHAARRADNDVHSALQHAQLCAHALTAVHRQHVKARQIPRVGLECFSDLDGQLARRRQHQHLGQRLGHVETLQQRQCERRGFAGAGLGLTNHIVTLQQMGDARRLNGCWALIARCLKGLKQWWGQTEVGKSHSDFRIRI